MDGLVTAKVQHTNLINLCKEAMHQYQYFKLKQAISVEKKPNEIPRGIVNIILYTHFQKGVLKLKQAQSYSEYNSVIKNTQTPKAESPNGNTEKSKNLLIDLRQKLLN